MQRTLKGILKETSFHTGFTLNSDAATDPVDTKNFRSLAVLIGIGSFSLDSSNFISVYLEESADNVTFTTVADQDIVNPDVGGHLVLNEFADQERAHLIHYKGTKRYVRVFFDTTGTVSGLASATALLGHPEEQPPF